MPEIFPAFVSNCLITISLRWGVRLVTRNSNNHSQFWDAGRQPPSRIHPALISPIWSHQTDSLDGYSFSCRMYECGTCWKAFPAGFNARNNHCDSTGHDEPEFECDTCDQNFDDNYERSEHMISWGHCANSRYKCNICIERFDTSQGQRTHEVNFHHYCQDCDRTFISLNNIKQVGNPAVLYTCRWINFL